MSLKGKIVKEGAISRINENDIVVFSVLVTDENERPINISCSWPEGKQMLKQLTRDKIISCQGPMKIVPFVGYDGTAKASITMRVSKLEFLESELIENNNNLK